MGIAKYHAVIFEENGKTDHVDVFCNIEQAKELQRAAGGRGRLVSGMANIIAACNWWLKTDSVAYCCKWVKDNAI